MLLNQIIILDEHTTLEGVTVTIDYRLGFRTYGHCFINRQQVSVFNRDGEPQWEVCQ